MKIHEIIIVFSLAFGGSWFLLAGADRQVQIEQAQGVRS